MPDLVTEATFPAMSTTVQIRGVGVPAREVARAAALGRHLAQQWEEWFSRFRSDSQLSRLNAAAGAAVRVEDVVLDLLDAVKVAVRRSGGRFDPSVLPALEAIGYDRSIERVGSSPRLATGEPRPAAGPQGWDRVCIDRAQGEAQLPPGMRIDLGGIAKGAFVDRLASELRSWPGGCVDAGGDLLVWGVPPDGDRWRIGIEDPFQPERDALVAGVLDCSVVGVATSGTYRRRWFAGGRMAHHLIDPSSGSPLLDDLRLVTAFAPDAMSAEIATKALMVAATGPSIPDSFGATMVVLIHADGRVEALPKEPRDAYSLPVVWPDHSSA